MSIKLFDESSDTLAGARIPLFSSFLFVLIQKETKKSRTNDVQRVCSAAMANSCAW